MPTSPTATNASEPIALPARFGEIIAEINRAIEAHLDEPSYPGLLTDSIRHAALGAGKRLRPALTLLTCEAVGADRSRAMAPAIAVELIHAFSLVHDDLPALDNDELRRGKPTVHVQFGEATAILAGDAMMSMAFGLLAQTQYDQPGMATALVQELAQATNRMIAGQVLDTVGGSDANADPLAQVRLIHEQKTGALLRASCRMGAIAGGADESALASITSFGESIGLMFQIVDDLIDVEQHEAHTGKKTGKDEDAGKLTYPGVLGIQGARDEANRLRDEAATALSHLGDRARTLQELTAYLACRTK